MSASFQLLVVTPERTVFEGEVKECRAPGATGEFGVLPEHIAYLTSVVPGPLRFEHEGARHAFALGRGFIQVVNDRVTILTQFAETKDELDSSELATKLGEAEAKMVEFGPSDEGFATALHATQDARARLALFAE